MPTFDKIIREYSNDRDEPRWLLELRLMAAKVLEKHKLSDELPGLDIEKSIQNTNSEKKVNEWKSLPEDVKRVYERLELPKAEQQFLAGINTQINNDVVYSQMKSVLEKEGVIFSSMDDAVKKYPNMVKRYIGKLIKYNKNIYTALNTAFWSGGTFIYVPKGVKVKYPLQAFFMINEKDLGQMERTLIVLEEDSYVQYIEGCAALVYRDFSYHLPVAEVFLHKGAHMKYITLQSWSKNIKNIVNGAAVLEDNAYIEWFDGNLGSGYTQKRPITYLKGDNARMRSIGLSYAGKGQRMKTGVEVKLEGKKTSAYVKSKSIAQDDGENIFDGIFSIDGKESICRSDCDSYLLGKKAYVRSIPRVLSQEKSSIVSHEASVGRVSEEELFYLKSRGLKEEQAYNLLILGIASEFLSEIPFEYANEFKKILSLKMKGVG